MAPRDPPVASLAMGAEQGEYVAIGKITVPFETAARWIRDYTDETHNSRARDPYAFPAYDRYDADCNEPGRLSDGYLLLRSCSMCRSR